MALKNCYGAFATKGYDLESYCATLDLAKATGQTAEVSKDVHFVLDTAVGVPSFPAPILHGGIVYVDAREFTTVAKDGSMQIKNMIEAPLRFDQACWEAIWAGNLIPPERIMTQMMYHVEVYSKWLSGAISQAYALDYMQQTQVMAACSLFVVGQYHNHIEGDVNTFRLQEMVARTLNIDINIYESITVDADNLFPRSLDEFIELLKNSNITPRLRDISSLSITQATGGSFWGVSQDRVLVSLAIEYPPAFYVIMSTCLTNTMFKKTRIGGVISKAKAGRTQETFLTAYQQIIARNTAPRQKRD